MRLLLAAPFLIMLSVAAGAQPAPQPTTTPSPALQNPPAAPPSAMPSRRHMTLQQRFDLANTTHDGHLTAQQARAGHLRSVASHFDAIDTSHQGSITLEQIQAYSRARRAAARAARQPASTVQN